VNLRELLHKSIPLALFGIIVPKCAKGNISLFAPKTLISLDGSFGKEGY
jgi:hypothetical protein